MAATEPVRVASCGVTRRHPSLLLAATVLVLGVLATTVPASAAPRPSSAGARAMWVWDRPGVPALVDFARRHGVRDLFVSTPGDLATSPDLPWFRSLRTSTSAAGIRLHALGAEVWWLDDHAAAAAWQHQVLATGLFDGVHLDVEPWLHPEWGSDPSALLTSWVALLQQSSAATGLRVEADIPFWLHEHAVGGRPADEAVIGAVDAVTVMSYRDTATGPDSITGISRTALATAGRLGRPVRLAVETRWLGDDPVSAKQTFFGSTQRQLDRALADVDAATAGHPTYAGVAVHDHRGWSALRR